MDRYHVTKSLARRASHEAKATQLTLKTPQSVASAAAPTAHQHDGPPTDQATLHPAQTWIREHPLQTACYAVGGGMILFPLAVATPVLGAVGFGAAGPVAGTLASATQSALAPVAAGGLFATLQSAAMGGYGTAVVAGTVQAASGVGMVAMGTCSFLKGGKRGKKGGKEDGKEDEVEDEDAKEGKKDKEY